MVPMVKMLRPGFILACLCWCTVLLGQGEKRNPDILFWSFNRPLSFSDFKGAPPKKDTALYETSAPAASHPLGYISTSIHVHYEPARGKTGFTIRAAMQKSASWIKQQGDTVSLQHEQGHFDICEMYARILRRDIRNARTLAEARKVYEKVSAMEEREQAIYDRENTPGAGGITLAWREQIQTRLKKLEAYKSPLVLLAIGK